MSIRGIIPGEWIVNSHYYATYAYGAEKNPPDYFITVRVELHRVNPYEIMWAGEKKFTDKGQEETFVRFTLDKEGRLVGSFNYKKKRFIQPTPLGM